MEKRNAVLAIAATLMVVSGAAMAEVPAAVTTAITGLGTDFSTVYDAAIGVMITIVGALVVWKYAKKLGLKV